MVLARLRVRTHQTCIALDIDSISGGTINDGLSVVIDFELGLGVALIGALGGPFPALQVIVSTG